MVSPDSYTFRGGVGIGVGAAVGSGVGVAVRVGVDVGVGVGVGSSEHATKSIASNEVATTSRPIAGLSMRLFPPFAFPISGPSVAGRFLHSTAETP